MGFVLCLVIFYLGGNQLGLILSPAGLNSETLALLQEQATTSQVLDACLKAAGFRMGPCELTDLRTRHQLRGDAERVRRELRRQALRVQPGTARDGGRRAAGPARRSIDRSRVRALCQKPPP